MFQLEMQSIWIALIAVAIASLYYWKKLVSDQLKASLRLLRLQLFRSKWRKDFNWLNLGKLLPLSARSGWLFVENKGGIRLWKRTVHALSAVQPVFATNAVINASAERILEVLRNHSMLKEWDSYCSHVKELLKSGDETDVISIVTSSGCNQSFSRSWKKSGKHSQILVRAIGQCQSDVEWVFWNLKSVRNGQTLVSLCLGISAVYFGKLPPEYLSSWLLSLQHFIHIQSCTESLKLPLGDPISNGKAQADIEIRNEKGERKTRKGRKKHANIKKKNSLPPCLVSEEQRKSWVHLTDVSAEQLKTMAAAGVSDGWEWVNKSKGVSIMKKRPLPQEQSSLNSVKGTADINVPAYFAFYYVIDLDKGKLWNEMFDEGIPVDILSADTTVTRLKYKAVFPTSPRDLCIVSGIREFDHGNVILTAVNSVQHPSCPDEDKYVRAETDNGGFLISKSPSNKRKCSATYITRVDLKGRLPTFVVNKVTSVQPMTVAVLRDLVEREYKKLSLEEKQKWEDMTMERFLTMRSVVLGIKDEVEDDEEEEEESGSEDEDENDETEGEDDKEVEEIFHNTNEIEKQTNSKSSMKEDVVPPATPMSFQEVEFPHKQDSSVDYRTLGNQICANVMAEFYLASGINLESDSQTLQSGGWLFQMVEKDVLVLKKSKPDSKYDCFMGRGVIELPPADVWNAIRDSRTRFVYDNMLKSLEIVEEVEAGLNIVYCLHETHNCFVKQGRDICFLHAERQENGKFIVAGRSVVHPKCPVKSNVTRAEVIASGWQIESLSKNEKSFSLVSYLVQINLGGFAPARLVNLIGKRQPLAIAYLRQHLMEQS